MGILHCSKCLLLLGSGDVMLCDVHVIDMRITYQEHVEDVGITNSDGAQLGNRGELFIE